MSHPHGNLTADDLRDLPTLAVGQADDLKLAGDGYQVWLSRCTVADGEPYDNKITVEQLVNGRWVTIDTYPGK